MGLMPVPVMQFMNIDGSLLAGGMLYSYAAGTTTPQATYTDATLGTPNANPVVLNSYGMAAIWLGTQSYKFILKDSLGNTLWTADQVQNIVPGSITSAMIAAGGVQSTNIAAGAVGSTQIATGGVATSNIANSAVTSAKIAPNGVALSNLSAITTILYKDTSDGAYGGGPRGFPMVPWSAPTPIAQPATIPVGTTSSVAWSPNGQFLALGNTGTGIAIQLFRRFNNILNNVTSRAGAPVDAALGVAWSPNGQYLVCIRGTSPYHTILQRSGDNFVALNNAGYILPSTTGVGGVAWSQDGQFLAFAMTASPYVKVLQKSLAYPANAVANYHSVNGQLVANNSWQAINFEVLDTDNMSAVATGAGWQFTVPRSGGYKIAAGIAFAAGTYTGITLALYVNAALYRVLDNSNFNNNGASGSTWAFLFAGATVQIKVYQNSGANENLTTNSYDNFISIVEDGCFTELPKFTALSNPGTLPGIGGTCCAWTSDSQFLAVGSILTPFIQTYQMVGTTITGLSAPSTLPNGQVNGCAWSPDGNFLALAVNVSPYIQIYTAVSGVLTLASYAGTTLPTGAAQAVAWSPNGALLAIAFAGSPYILIYAWNGTTFTTLANPGTLPPGTATGLSWICDGKYLAVSNLTTPYLTVYETSGFVPVNAVNVIGEDYLV